MTIIVSACQMETNVLQSYANNITNALILHLKSNSQPKWALNKPALEGGGAGGGGGCGVKQKK